MALFTRANSSWAAELCIIVLATLMVLPSCSAARGSGLKLLSVLPGKWSMSSPMSLDDSYYEGEVLGRMEFVESSDQELIIVGIYYENVTSSSDVKNQKSVRVTLSNDTAGQFMACRQGGNKFSFSSSPIPLSSTDVVHPDTSAAGCFSFPFSFHSNLKDALWTASGPATILGNPGTFQWIMSPSSNDMVLTLHSANGQETWSITATKSSTPGVLSHWAPWIMLLVILVMSRVFSRAKSHPRLKPVPDKFAKRSASNPTSPKGK